MRPSTSPQFPLPTLFHSTTYDTADRPTIDALKLPIYLSFLYGKWDPLPLSKINPPNKTKQNNTKQITEKCVIFLSFNFPISNF